MRVDLPLRDGRR